MRRAGLVLVALSFVIAPASAQAGGNIDVTGFVGERTGLFPGAAQPLAGASVQLMQNDAQIDSDTTNASGNYTVTAPVGQLEIVVSKTNYVTQCRKAMGIGAPFTPPPIEMPTPAQGGGLSGTVTDSFTDQPVQGVTVEVSYDQGCDPVAPSVQTDSNGLYLFPSVPGPEHLVTYSKAGYNSRTDEVTVYGGATVNDPQLEPVDTTDPRTKIRSLTVDGRKATVKFKAIDPPPSSGGLNFSCRLDGGDTESCESPKTYAHLAKGRHKVKIIAFDAVGNFDSTPAKERFKVG